MFFCYWKANISKDKNKKQKHLESELQYHRNKIYDLNVHPHWFIKNVMNDDENDIDKPNMSSLPHTTSHMPHTSTFPLPVNGSKNSILN